MVHGGCVAAEADRERMDNSSGPNTLKYFLDILVCPRSVRNCPRPKRHVREHHVRGLIFWYFGCPRMSTGAFDAGKDQNTCVRVSATCQRFCLRLSAPCPRGCVGNLMNSR